MPDIALVLGPVLFREFEVPSRIDFGGRQRVVVHSMPGGARVIDVLGRDDAQIRFAGIFSGSDATLRVRALDELRSAGLPLPLTWDVFFYRVIITELQFDYRSGWWIPYNIVCTVLHEESNLLDVPVSLANIIATDMDAAVTYASEAELDISALQCALIGSSATRLGIGASAATRTLFAATQAAIDVAASNANDLIQCSNLPFGNSAQDGVANLLSATDAMRQLGSLMTASSYVTRVILNLENAST